MNLTFKIRVNTIEKSQKQLITNDKKVYPIFDTFNPDFRVLKQGDKYILLKKIPTSGKQLQIATTKASVNQKIKDYLSKQNNDEAKALLKELNHE
ncbi:hypothetical protein IKS57_00385 [bacterium]|nr:hypothetical protein [bacterium]